MLIDKRNVPLFLFKKSKALALYEENKLSLLRFQMQNGSNDEQSPEEKYKFLIVSGNSYCNYLLIIGLNDYSHF